MTKGVVSKRKKTTELDIEKNIIPINSDDIPKIIFNTIDSISDYEKKIRSSEKSANEAMNYIKKMASYRRGTLLGFRHGNTRDIVEAHAEGLEKLANAQDVTVTAMQKALEFNKKLADSCKYLFALGCANIAANRIAVRAIEKKLDGAKKEEISDLARQEMMSVVRQLKAQEDILARQEYLTNKLDEKEKNDIAQSQKIADIKELLEQKGEVISANAEAIAAITEYLKQKDIIDNEQTVEIEKIKNSSDKKLCIIAIMIASFGLICGIASVVLQLIS